MKKMKFFTATAIVAMAAAVVYVGYTAYEQVTMTDTEYVIQANLEALTNGESEGNVTCKAPWSPICTTLGVYVIYGTEQ
ncbi:MAG: NVEALA domain-containing protein [Rikenellaceae bacterium]